MKLTTRGSARRAATRLVRAVAFAFCLALLLGGASSSNTTSTTPQAVDHSPEDGAVLDRPVRSLRVWFDHAPDVAASELSLEGPAGADLEVTGLHTMGEEDLMARVVGRMPDGKYTATWRIGSGDGAATGSWSFEVRRGRSDAEQQGTAQASR